MVYLFLIAIAIGFVDIIRDIMNLARHEEGMPGLEFS